MDLYLKSGADSLLLPVATDDQHDDDTSISTSAASATAAEPPALYVDDALSVVSDNTNGLHDGDELVQGAND